MKTILLCILIVLRNYCVCVRQMLRERFSTKQAFGWETRAFTYGPLLLVVCVIKKQALYTLFNHGSMDLKVFALISLAISLYIVLGGLLFQLLEQSAFLEQENYPDHVVKHKIKNKQTFDSGETKIVVEKLLDEIYGKSKWRLDWKINKFGNESMSDGKSFLDFQIFVKKWDQWDLYGSIFYAETIVTTIGYGHISPSTPIGRMITCLYALFGVPLLGLWGSAIGENIIKFANAVRKRVTPNRKWHRTLLVLQASAVAALGTVFFILIPAIFFREMEEWTYLESVYCKTCYNQFYFMLKFVILFSDAVISISTIGFGDLVAGAQEGAPTWYRIFVCCWLMFGLGWLSMIISLLISIFRVQATQVVHQAQIKVAQIKVCF